MSAEVDYFRFEDRGISKFEEVIVPPDSDKKIDLLGLPIKFLVHCGIDNIVEVLVNTRLRKLPDDLQAVVYEDNDDEGKKVRLKDGVKIPLKEPQALTISLYRRESRMSEEIIILSSPLEEGAEQ